MYYPVLFLLYRIRACLAALLHRWTHRLTPNRMLRCHGQRRPIPDTRMPGLRLLNAPKPSWVREELLRMKAQVPEASSRFLAASFNRRFRVARQMMVGKTYVAEMLKQHAYEIQFLSTELKRRPPRLVPLHLIWGLDLTGKTDRDGNTHSLLGIVEHASRANLALRALTDKTILTLLEQLIGVIRRYGKPRIIHTGDEPLFQAKRFQIVLWLPNIKHQRTEPCCP